MSRPSWCEFTTAIWCVMRKRVSPCWLQLCTVGSYHPRPLRDAHSSRMQNLAWPQGTEAPIPSNNTRITLNAYVCSCPTPSLSSPSFSGPSFSSPSFFSAANSSPTNSAISTQYSAGSGPLSVNKLFTSCIRWCPVSLACFICRVTHFHIQSAFLTYRLSGSTVAYTWFTR